MPNLDMLVSEKEWPIAIYRGPMQRMAGMFLCETPYSKAAQRDGVHRPITLVIIRYNCPGRDPNEGRRMEYLDRKFSTVQDALMCLLHILDQKRDWQPKII
jgi:hypothetical protein